MLNKKRLAVIDVGTLKSKFEIREVNHLENQVLYKDKKLTVLGRDLPRSNNHIIEKAVKTTIEALREFKQKMDEFGVTKYRAITTEAVRKATNAAEVLERIKRETGIKLEVMTHEDEAKIFFLHVAKNFPGQRVAVTDIGGGSVQLVVGRDADIEHIHLFKTGTYFMQEAFSQTHHPSLAELKAARDYVAQEFSQLRTQGVRADELVYGSTNIIDFVQAMRLPLHVSGHASPHPYRVARDDLEKLYEQIIALPYEERMPMFPAEPYYMWAADKALMNIFELMSILRVDSVVPTNENISSGLFSNLYKTA